MKTCEFVSTVFIREALQMAQTYIGALANLVERASSDVSSSSSHIIDGEAELADIQNALAMQACEQQQQQQDMIMYGEQQQMPRKTEML